MGRVRGETSPSFRTGAFRFPIRPCRRKGGGGRQPLGTPRQLRAFPPPSLVSISVCGRSLAEVSPEGHCDPARNGTQAAASAVLGGRGRIRSKTGQAPNGGGGEGAKPSPTPHWGNRGGAYLAMTTLGADPEIAVAPVSGGSCLGPALGGRGSRASSGGRPVCARGVRAVRRGGDPC